MTLLRDQHFECLSAPVQENVQNTVLFDWRYDTALPHRSESQSWSCRSDPQGTRSLPSVLRGKINLLLYPFLAAEVPSTMSAEPRTNICQGWQFMSLGLLISRRWHENEIKPSGMMANSSGL